MKEENRIPRQQQLIMQHLEDRGSITTLEAFNAYDIARLGSVVHDLRAKGLPIATMLETGTNRFGVRVQYARYRLELPRRICPVDGKMCTECRKNQG